MCGFKSEIVSGAKRQSCQSQLIKYSISQDSWAWLEQNKPWSEIFPFLKWCSRLHLSLRQHLSHVQDSMQINLYCRSLSFNPPHICGQNILGCNNPDNGLIPPYSFYYHSVNLSDGSTTQKENSVCTETKNVQVNVFNVDFFFFAWFLKMWSLRVANIFLKQSPEWDPWTEKSKQRGWAWNIGIN